MNIRAAHVADVAAIARVHVASWRATYSGIVPDAYLTPRLSLERRVQQWQAILDNPNRAETVFVATDDLGQIVGFASCGPSRSPDPIYPDELYAIYLQPETQRQGIGRALVAAVAMQLLQQGSTAMMLWALIANSNGCDFYEHLGGQVIGYRDDDLDGAIIPHVAYGWADIRSLAILPRRR